MTTQPEEVNLKGNPITPEEQSWLEYSRKSHQEVPQRLEEAAKYLSGMISISFTIFLTVNKDGFKGLENNWKITLAIGLWLSSLIATFIVLFPLRYNYSKDSAESIEKMVSEIITFKYIALTVASVFFIVALCILSWAYLTNVG
jgi:hypothetical protein